MADPRDPDAAYIPADDVLLRGYCGPCKVWTPDSGGTGALRGTGHWASEIVGACYLHGQDVRLDVALAPVRDHIARVVAEGAPCHICLRAKFPDAPACATCRGSGYILPPTPIEHLMDRPGSRLTAAQSAVFVADAYDRWRRGLDIPAVIYDIDRTRHEAWMRDRSGTFIVHMTATLLRAERARSYVVDTDGTVTTPELPTDRSHK